MSRTAIDKTKTATTRTRLSRRSTSARTGRRIAPKASGQPLATKIDSVKAALERKRFLTDSPDERREIKMAQSLLDIGAGRYGDRKFTKVGLGRAKEILDRPAHPNSAGSNLWTSKGASQPELTDEADEKFTELDDCTTLFWIFCK
jgi:hypothetical protein